MRQGQTPRLPSIVDAKGASRTFSPHPVTGRFLPEASPNNFPGGMHPEDTRKSEKGTNVSELGGDRRRGRHPNLPCTSLHLLMQRAQIETKRPPLQGQIVRLSMVTSHPSVALCLIQLPVSTNHVTLAGYTQHRHAGGWFASVCLADATTTSGRVNFVGSASARAPATAPSHDFGRPFERAA